jgi:hypothetical protein
VLYLSILMDFAEVKVISLLADALSGLLLLIYILIDFFHIYGSIDIILLMTCNVYFVGQINDNLDTNYE